MADATWDCYAIHTRRGNGEAARARVLAEFDVARWLKIGAANTGQSAVNGSH